MKKHHQRHFSLLVVAFVSTSYFFTITSYLKILGSVPGEK